MASLGNVLDSKTQAEEHIDYGGVRAKKVLVLGRDSGDALNDLYIDSSGVGRMALYNAAIVGAGDPVIDSYTHLAINLAAGNDQVLVASAASKQIWVYGITFTVNVAGTVSFQDEDNTAITGVMNIDALGGIAINPSGNFAMPIWKLATNKDLEVDIVTSELDGFLTYAIVSV